MNDDSYVGMTEAELRQMYKEIRQSNLVKLIVHGKWHYTELEYTLEPDPPVKDS